MKIYCWKNTYRLYRRDIVKYNTTNGVCEKSLTKWCYTRHDLYNFGTNIIHGFQGFPSMYLRLYLILMFVPLFMSQKMEFLYENGCNSCHTLVKSSWQSQVFILNSTWLCTETKCKKKKKLVPKFMGLAVHSKNAIVV